MSEDSMRIAILTSEFPPHCGGIGLYVEKLAASLARRNHKIEIITRRKASENPSQVIAANLTIRRFDFMPLFPMGNFRMGREVTAYLSTLNREIDLLNVHHPAPILVKTKVPTILTVHNSLAANSEPLRYGEGIPSAARLTRPVMTLFERRCLMRYQTLAAVSNTVASQIKSFHNTAERQIKVLGNGVELERYLRIGRDCRNNYIVYSGRLHKSKSLNLLLKSFQRVLATHPQQRLVLIGRGPDEKKLRAMSRDLSIERNVVFTGWLTGGDYIETIGRAAIYVQPSPYEGLSTGMLEAMATGVCTLVSDIPNNREVITDLSNGRLFKSGDHIDLTEKMLSLINDGRLRERLEENALDTIEQTYQWQFIVNRFEELASTIVRNRR